MHWRSSTSLRATYNTNKAHGEQEWTYVIIKDWVFPRKRGKSIIPNKTRWKFIDSAIVKVGCRNKFKACGLPEGLEEEGHFASGLKGFPCRFFDVVENGKKIERMLEDESAVANGLGEKEETKEGPCSSGWSDKGPSREFNRSRHCRSSSVQWLPSKTYANRVALYAWIPKNNKKCSGWSVSPDFQASFPWRAAG